MTKLFTLLLVSNLAFAEMTCLSTFHVGPKEAVKQILNDDPRFFETNYDKYFGVDFIMANFEMNSYIQYLDFDITNILRLKEKGSFSPSSLSVHKLDYADLVKLFEKDIKPRLEKTIQRLFQAIQALPESGTPPQEQLRKRLVQDWTDLSERRNKFFAEVKKKESGLRKALNDIERALDLP